MVFAQLPWNYRYSNIPLFWPLNDFVDFSMLDKRRLDSLVLSTAVSNIHFVLFGFSKLCHRSSTIQNGLLLVRVWRSYKRNCGSNFSKVEFGQNQWVGIIRHFGKYFFASLPRRSIPLSCFCTKYGATARGWLTYLNINTRRRVNPASLALKFKKMSFIEQILI